MRLTNSAIVLRTIPILFLGPSDPVENGLVASLARPGGNTTGFAIISAEIDGKRLELLKEAIPSLSRVVFLMNPDRFPSQFDARFASAAAAAKTLGITLQRIDASTPDELTAALTQIQASSAEALMIFASPLIGRKSRRILAFIAAHRLPSVTDQSVSTRAHLLMYGSDSLAMTRLAASYVDKILKGAKPADLPVQLPTKFLLNVNLSTAKALGLTIPWSILSRADEVIE